MKKRKKYLHLSDTERRLILQRLLEYRNKLISQDKYTDGVDELIIKYTKQARELTSRACLQIYKTIDLNTKLHPPSIKCNGNLIL